MIMEALQGEDRAINTGVSDPMPPVFVLGRHQLCMVKWGTGGGLSWSIIVMDLNRSFGLGSMSSIRMMDNDARFK